MRDSFRNVHWFALDGPFAPSPRTFWALALTAHLPLVVIYLIQMCGLEQYHFVPFLLVGAVAFAWNRIAVPLKYPKGRLVNLLLGTSLLSLAIGSILFSPWFGAIGFVCLLTSFFIAHGQPALCVPLVLLIRLPMNLDVEMVTYLQTITSRLSSYILDLVGLPHLLLGNVIQLADRELFVAEACSGVQSVFSIAFFALMIVVWRRRPLLLTPLYLTISLVLAVLGNTLRVTIIAYMLGRYDIDLSAGIPHSALGYSTLILAGLLTFSADSMLALIFHPINVDGATEDNLAIRFWNWLFKSPTSVMDQAAASLYRNRVGAIGILQDVEGIQQLDGHSRQSDYADFPKKQSLTLGFSHRGFMIVMPVIGLLSIISLVMQSENASAMIAIESDKPILEPRTQLLDDLNDVVQFRYAETMRGSTDPRLGKNADQWDARFQNLIGRLVFSHPYEGWHDLNICYRGTGWTDIETSMIQPSETMLDRTKLAYSRFVRSDGANGYLLFTAISASGDVMPPPENLEGLLALALNRCGRLLGHNPENAVPSQGCAMLQLWMVTDDEIDKQQLMVLADSLTKVRTRFVDAIRSADSSSIKN